jgi:hypothetical protein
MITRNIPRGKRRPARKADNLIAICEPIVYKIREPRRLKTLLAPTACYRVSFAFIVKYKILYISTFHFLSALLKLLRQSVSLYMENISFKNNTALSKRGSGVV